MFAALMLVLVLSVVLVSAAGYRRAMDDLFGSEGDPMPPRTPGLTGPTARALAVA